MRHGEVHYFSPAGKPLRAHAVGLNATGRRQSDAAAEALAGLPLDRAISSPVRRARETAEIILGGRDVRLEIGEELAEIAGGRLRDIPVAELEASFVDAFGRDITRDSRFLGGERFGDFVDRILPRWQAIISEPGWSDLLLVLHAAVNRVILAHVLGLELGGLGALEQDAACLNIIDLDGRRPLVRLVNYTPYNALKGGTRLTVMEQLLQQYRRD
jgi:phosphoserine phosphatase